MWREVRDWFEELACRAGFDGIPGGGRLALWVAAGAVVAIGAYVLLAQSGGAGGAPQVPAADRGPEASATVASSGAALPAQPASLTVHVVGEVRHPGVYTLAVGSRAIDAIDAAGGLLGDAEQGAVNLAREIADGEQIVVPRQGESAAVPGGATGVSASGSAGGKVNLNSASAEQLDALPGIGPSTAAKIITDRTENGPFKSVDDLMRVPGIGPAKFEALKDLVSAG